MSANKKVIKGCLIAFIAVTVLTAVTVIAFFFCGIISAVAIPQFAKSKNQHTVTLLTNRAHTAQKTLEYSIKTYKKPSVIIVKSINELNTAGSPDDISDDPKSPYNNKYEAFSTIAGPGVIAIQYNSDMKGYNITGYDDKLLPVITLSIPAG